MYNKTLLFVTVMISVLGGCNPFTKTELNRRNSEEKELERYAEKLQGRFEEFPNDVFSGQIDVDYLFERIYQAGLPKSLTDFNIKSDLASSINQLTYKLGQEMKGGYSDLLGFDSETSQILYRLYNAEGLNYYQFLVVTNEDNNTVRIGDVYIFSSGEYLSQTLARIYKSNLAGSNAFIKQYSREKTEAIMQLSKARQLMILGSHTEAKEMLDSAWMNFDDKKTWHLLNINCSMMIDSLTYINAVEHFARDFSNDPAWLIQGIDYYYTIKDWDKAQDLVSQVRDRVGQDPVLNLFEADIEWSLGDHEKSLAILNDGIAQMPEFENFYYSKFMVSGLMGKYEEVYATLQTLFEDFDVTIEDMDFSSFPKFKESGYYKELAYNQQID